MIIKFRTELFVLGVLILNIFILYNVDIIFFNLFKDLNNSLQYIYLKEFFKQITVLGNSIWYFILSISIFVICYLSKKYSYFNKQKSNIETYKIFSLFLFFSLIVVGLLTQLIKHVVGRARPNYITVESNAEFIFFNLNSEFHSFPSGHTSTIFVVALVIAFFIPKLKYFFIFLAGVIAFSRIVVGAHFLTDVIGGIAVSYLGTKLTMLFFDKYYPNMIIKKKQLFSNNKIYFSFIVFVCLIVFLSIGSSIDIYLSSLFYYGNSQFLLQSYYNLTIFFRKIILPLTIIYILILPIISMLLPTKKFYFGYKFKFADIVFLWASNIFNLLIIINFFLKNVWGRARPGDILQLGGKENFTAWYQISDSCNSNCSFVSGDAAVGFSIIALYFLTKKEVFFWLSLFLGCSLGLIRIMEGGHFLSDIVMSAVILYLSLYFQTKYYLKKYA